MREPVTFTSCNEVGALSCAKAGDDTSIRDDSASTSGRGRSALWEADMGFLGELDGWYGTGGLRGA